MIDEETKKALLKELEKIDNVFTACQKIGIAPATYYRWIKNDKQFRKDANAAKRVGRQNISDLAEHALLIKIKEGNMDAVKFGLVHNNKRYMHKKNDRITIEHVSSGSKTPLSQERTLEDLFDEADRENEALIKALREKYEKMGELPLKPNGTPIEGDELIEYEVYIINHLNKQNKPSEDCEGV